MENKKWKGTTGEFSPVFTSNKSRAIRNEGGIVCTITKPDKYLGQDERFEKDLVIEKCDQDLILDAFNTIQKYDMMPSELLVQRDEALLLLEELEDELRDNKYFSSVSERAKQLISKIKGDE